MSSQEQLNTQTAPQDEEDEETVLYEHYPYTQDSRPRSQYPAFQQADRYSPNAYAPNAHVQTSGPLNSSHSPVSLRQYALFPDPMRPITPAPGMSYQSSPPVNTPSSSQTQQLQTPGSDAPDPQTPGRKAFVCQKCGASFGRRFDLKRHMHSHSEQREFICPQCHKALARSDSLQRHQATCKGPRPS